MKIVCVYHSIDLDGWMSAAIVKHWFKINYPKSISSVDNYDNFIPTEESIKDTLSFYGYNYGQPIPDLSEYDKVIMCDISFPAKEMEYIGEKLIWIDHHISAITDSGSMGYDMSKGLRNTKFAACELTWKYFFPNKGMPEIVRLLGRYDCFGHKGTDEETKVLEFQYGARQCISNYEEAYDKLKQVLFDDFNGIDTNNYHAVINNIHRQGKSIYQYLCTEAKQAYKNGFGISLPNVTVPEEEYVFICINKERFNPINFGINYHDDGYDGCACFWYANNKWSFSLYNDNELVDCSLIAKQFGGGGHKGAAGFVVDDIYKVIK
jgi:oligoribonuclease NrnB/cAMP/cGMP phosphodiesterase (DHH superfamily)